MNRRKLIAQLGHGIAGFAAAVVGVKASTAIDLTRNQPMQTVIVRVHAESSFEEAVIKTVTDDYKNNGKLREVIESDR